MSILFSDVCTVIEVDFIFISQSILVKTSIQHLEPARQRTAESTSRPGYTFVHFLDQALALSSNNTPNSTNYSLSLLYSNIQDANTTKAT